MNLDKPFTPKDAYDETVQYWRDAVHFYRQKQRLCLTHLNNPAAPKWKKEAWQDLQQACEAGIKRCQIQLDQLLRRPKG